MKLQLSDGVETNGDPRLLRVVLENLLCNAWKYTAKTADAAICLPGTFNATERPGKFLGAVKKKS